MNIGERIIKHRKQNGWSQEEFSGAAGRIQAIRFQVGERDKHA